MVGHGGSSAGSYLTDPTSPIPSHCASIVVASTVRVNKFADINPVHFILHFLCELAGLVQMCNLSSFKYCTLVVFTTVQG